MSSQYTCAAFILLADKTPTERKTDCENENYLNKPISETDRRRKDLLTCSMNSTAPQKQAV